MLKAIKIQAYPNVEQKVAIAKVLGCARVVANKALDEISRRFDEDGEYSDLKSLGTWFSHTLRPDKDFFYVADENTHVLKQALIDRLKGMDNFYRNHKINKAKGQVEVRKDGKFKGFPRYKKRNDHENSCRYPYTAISKKNVYSDRKISLAGIKDLSFRGSDRDVAYLAKYKDGIKSATLIRTRSGKYFISILVNSDEIIEKRKNLKKGGVLGLDPGLTTLITTSEGVKYNNPRFYQRSEEKQKILQQRLSTKVWGSKNYEKARIKLARNSEKTANRRLNEIHRITNDIIHNDDNEIVAIEGSSSKNMMQNHNLAKSFADASWGLLKQVLKYKCGWHGKIYYETDKFFASSKTCSCCGYKNDNLKLHTALWACPQCGVELDRDLNASINIRNQAIKDVEQGLLEL